DARAQSIAEAEAQAREVGAEDSLEGLITPRPHALPTKRGRSWAVYVTSSVALAAVLGTGAWRLGTKQPAIIQPRLGSVVESVPPATIRSADIAEPSAIASTPPPSAQPPSSVPGACPPARGGSRPRTPRSPPPASPSTQHCDWHNQDGIWVPTCR